jgi:hypothetical protein
MGCITLCQLTTFINQENYSRARLQTSILAATFHVISPTGQFGTPFVFRYNLAGTHTIYDKLFIISFINDTRLAQRHSGLADCQ